MTVVSGQFTLHIERVENLFVLSKNAKPLGKSIGKPPVPQAMPQPATRPAVKAVACATCSGTGRWEINRTGEVGDFDVEECPDCGGSGRRKVSE